MTTLLPGFRRSSGTYYPTRDLFDRFIEGFGWPVNVAGEGGWSPPVDVMETESDMIVRVEIPGMNENDVDINLSHGLLSISGEKKVETSEEESCRCVESCSGKFNRTVSVPFDVDEDKVEAKFRDGVLRITLPKSEAAKPKKIEITH